MSKQLEGKRIAILATDGFEQVELTDPKKNLEADGAKVTVLSIKPGEGGKAGEIKGWDKTDWGKTVKVDGLVYDASVDQFDALVLPGGQINPDKLRVDKDAVAFVKKFAESGKTVAAICHGPWTLIEAGVVKGKTMTSWPSVSTDLKNAGAHWVDKEVVVDGNFITSRKPADIPAFSKAIVESVSNGARDLVPVGVRERDGARGVKFGYLFGGQVPAGGGEVCAELLFIAGTDDQRGDRGSLEEPVEGDLGDGLAGFFGNEI